MGIVSTGYFYTCKGSLTPTCSETFLCPSSLSCLDGAPIPFIPESSCPLSLFSSSSCSLALSLSLSAFGKVYVT